MIIRCGEWLLEPEQNNTSQVIDLILHTITSTFSSVGAYAIETDCSEAGLKFEAEMGEDPTGPRLEGIVR
jgi:hypothetical protein